MRNSAVIFAFIGSCFFIGAGYAWFYQTTKIESMLTTQGRVIQNISRRSSNSTTYRPRVEYQVDGELYSYTSNTGSNPPSFDIGERVEVFYDPKNPKKAQINSFLQLHFLSLFLSLFGSIFGGIGFGILYYLYRKKQKIDYLRRSGIKIELQIKRVFKNTRLKINGNNPWKVETEGFNPISNKNQVFQSDNLFEMPNLKEGETIFVLIDRRDSKRYWVDTTSQTQGMKAA